MLFMMASRNTLLQGKLTHLEIIVMVIMNHKLLVKNISDQRIAYYCQTKLYVTHIAYLSVCHGGNSDDLVSISAMTGTVAVNFCVYFNGLYI